MVRSSPRSSPRNLFHAVMCWCGWCTHCLPTGDKYLVWQQCIRCGRKHNVALRSNALPLLQAHMRKKPAAGMMNSRRDWTIVGIAAGVASVGWVLLLWMLYELWQLFLTAI